MYVKQAIAKVVDDSIAIEDIKNAFKEMMEGKADDTAIGAFLTALRIKGESIDHLKAAYDVMLDHAIRLEIDYKHRLIDTCGTGGDKLKTFNISTATAFVASALGVKVAKHGNRSMTGFSGSADILESIGYNLDLDKDKVKESIDTLDIGFLFAPKFHPAMKNVARARKAIGIRSIFNILGPLANPCNINAQIVGVSEQGLLDKVARLLLLIGREEAMVFYSYDGFDELSITSNNKILWVKDDKIDELIINPKSFGMEASISDIVINSKEQAINSFMLALNGYDKHKSNMLALNTAAALIVAREGYSFSNAIEEAKDAINSGKAYGKLREFIKRYGNYARLREVEDACLS